MPDNKEKDLTEKNKAGNTHELSILVREIDEHKEDLQKVMENFKQNIQELNNENFTLRKLPQKMQDKLQAVVPDIAREIEKNYENIIGDFNNHIKTCNDNLIAFSENAKNRIKTSAETAEAALDQVQKRAKIVADSYWKKLMLHSLFTGFIASIMAFAVSYMMIEYAPKKIFIDTPRGLVTIDKSEVNIMTNDVRVKPKQHGK